MNFPFRAISVGVLASCALGVSGGRAHAQNYGPPSGSLYTGGGSSYLPYGANMSGFIPYTPGPGGGLGAQPRMSPVSSARPPIVGAGMGGGMGVQLGQPRSAIAPLRPISAMGMGGGGLIRRAPAAAPAMGGGMGGTSRPPVGGYPFRQPPSLVSPSTPAMSM